MATTIDTLLAMTLPQPQTREVRVPRLTLPDGTALTLTVRQLTYNQVASLREHSKDFDVHTVLAGVTAPNLRDKALLERFGAETPAELVKAMFLPGEIEDISAEVSRLAGYNRRTVELVQDIQKN